MLQAALAVLLLAWLTAAASVPDAMALPAQGHVFGSAFGSPGAGEGQFVAPSQVAVDEATGEVFVVDEGGERVEAFKPAAGGGYEFVAQFKVHTPGAIAVDNSTAEGDPSRGDVFVAGASEKGASAEERDVVEVYDPAQRAIVHKLKIFRSHEAEEELYDVSGVAVDGAGTLWVYWEEGALLDAFGKERSKSEGLKLAWQASRRRTPEVESKFECAPRPVFAVGPGEAFYAGYERESVSERCPGEEGLPPDTGAVAKLEGPGEMRTVLRELDHQDTTGVAAEAGSGDVFLDNVSEVAAFTPGGSLIERFGAGTLGEASGMAVDAANGDAFVVDRKSDRVAVFVPEEAAGAPEVDGVSATNLTPISSELHAQIDPKGAETEYAFQYGASDCESDPSACSELPAGHLAAGFGDRDVSAVVGSLSPATAYFYRVVAKNAHGSVQGTGQPNTFTTLPSPGVLPDGRAWELVSPVAKHGAAVEVASRFRGAEIRAAADGSGLVWAATGPVVSEPQGNRSFELSQLLSTRGASEWGTTSLETPHDEGRGLRSPSPSEYHYFSPDLSTSLVQPTEPFGTREEPPLASSVSEKTMYVRSGGEAGEGQFAPVVSESNDTAHNKFGGELEFLDATPDLRHVVFESAVGLTAEHPTAPGLYEWDAQSGALQLVSVLADGSPAPDTPGSTPALGDGGGLNERDAIASDGSRVFWTEGDERALYLRDTARGETIEVSVAQGNDATEPGPGGQTPPEPEAEHQIVHFQAADSTGTVVLFTDTARLSEESSQEPLGEEPPVDLYEFQMTSGAGEPLRGRLTDLTPDFTEGSADVLNLIPGASPDGNVVYFMANGVLAPGAERGECPRSPAEAEETPPQPDTACNLYVSEPDPQNPAQRQTRFIARLSYEDAADWGAGLSSNLAPSEQNLAAVSASVSPDGRYLAFMSERDLTGYDNRDLAGGEADEEVYLYDSLAHRLSCVSCNPNAEAESGGGGVFKRPAGIFDAEAAGETPGLLVDRPELWLGHGLAGSLPAGSFNITDARPLALYRPREVLDDGRVFFDSPDSLVPGAAGGVENVYEYEPQGTGSCAFSAGCVGLISSGSGPQESTFLDAGESGEDVFFTTAAQLVPGDTDQAYDIYDAHVCSQASPCISSSVTSTPPQCESASECRGPYSSTGQVAATSATTSSHPPEGVAKQGVQPSKTKAQPKPKALTRAQKLARALALCRKLHAHSRTKRIACERAARRTYSADIRHASKKHVGKTTTGKGGAR
jgi:WD40-like Beta Propeller Repeat